MEAYGLQAVVIVEIFAVANNAMDLLKDFLESSTIHGLIYISSAGVSLKGLILFLTVTLSDKVSKVSMGTSCLP